MSDLSIQTNPKNRIKKDNVNYGLLSFVVVFIMGLIMFFPSIVWTKGVFVYISDYNAQQIPFYIHAHEMVRSGNFGWDWCTDLGANFIGSYSFYLIGSLFFWLTIPFPSVCVPYLMAPLLVLKMAFMSLAAFYFFKLYVKPRFAFIGGILYAFSGYTIFNITYNHFLEAMVYFPVMILGLEMIMRGKKHGLFALFVFLSALNNYYFFIGQAVFLIVYFVVKLIAKCPDWNVNVKNILLLVFEAVLGTAMAGIILLPAYFAIFQNTRVNEKLAGWDAILYTNPKRYANIIHSFFFPPDSIYRSNMFADVDKFESVSAWIPMFGCTGAIAYIQMNKKKNWLRKCLIVFLVFSLVPILNSSFQLFSISYYARWFYMFEILIILATLFSLQNVNRTKWNRAFLWSGGITLLFTLVIGCMPSSWGDPNKITFGEINYRDFRDDLWEQPEKFKIGLEEYAKPFWMYVFITFLGLALAYLVITLYKKKNHYSFLALFSAVAFISLFSSIYFMVMPSVESQTYTKYFLNEVVLDRTVPETLDKDNDYYRMDYYVDADNRNMYWELPGFKTFHSIVPDSIVDFYTYVGMYRVTSVSPPVSNMGLRSLFSVKYMIDYANTGKYTCPKNVIKTDDNDSYFFSDEAGNTIVPGYKFLSNDRGYNVYLNENYIPMGFTYDNYITLSDLKEMNIEDREYAMIKCLVINDEQEDKVSKILNHKPISAEEVTLDSYFEDCKKRSETTVDNFQYTSYGFTGDIQLDKSNIVFFSVPYENGWTAKVNGKKAEIIHSNVGFMSVVCPAGDSKIEFTYQTPGLKTGTIITAVCGIAYVAYLVLVFVFNKRKMKQEEGVNL